MYTFQLNISLFFPMWTQHLAQVWHTAGRKYLWTVQINLKLKNSEMPFSVYNLSSN